MHVNILALIYVYPMRSEEGLKFPGTGVTNGREPPPGSWELNPGPLKE